MEFSHLPGGDLVAKGLEDLARSSETVEALLLSIAAPRLRDLGVRIADPLPDAERLRRFLRELARAAEADAAVDRLESQRGGIPPPRAPRS